MTLIPPWDDFSWNKPDTTNAGFTSIKRRRITLAMVRAVENSETEDSFDASSINKLMIYSSKDPLKLSRINWDNDAWNEFVAWIDSMLSKPNLKTFT
jgi:hypothetical protein